MVSLNLKRPLFRIRPVPKYAFEAKVMNFVTESLNKFCGLAYAKPRNFEEIMAKIQRLQLKWYLETGLLILRQNKSKQPLSSVLVPPKGIEPPSYP